MSVFRRLKRHRKIKRASINPQKLSIVRMLFEHKSCNIFTLTYTASAAEQLYTLTSYVGGKKSDCGFKLNVNLSDIETLTRFFFARNKNICHVREDLGLQENREGIRNRVSWIVEHAPLSTPEKGFALFS